MIDAIIAFSFGHPASLKSNQIIAEEAVRLAQLYGVPIITQRDVPLENRLEVEFVDAIGEKRISVLRIVQRFAVVAKERRWKNVLLVAAPDFVERCARDLQKFGFRIFTPCDLDRKRYSQRTWFSKNSGRWFMRFRFAFVFREFCIRFLPWWVYKRIAGEKSPMLEI